MKKSLSAAMVIAALALTSACGGGDERPTKGEVEKSLTSKDSVFGASIPETAAKCVADVLVDSKLSNKTLNAVAEGDEDYKGSKKEQKTLTDLTPKIADCAKP